MLSKSMGLKPMTMIFRMNLTKPTMLLTFLKRLRGGYQGEPSLFDKISPDDLIFAFFPCTYFSDQSPRHLCCTAYQYKNYTIEQKCEVSMKRHRRLSLFYEILNKFVIVCQRKHLRLIIENPLSTSGMHYLTHFWCIKPNVIDKDRTLNGDYYKKPTQYWFIGLQPKNNLVFEPLEVVEVMKQRYVTSDNPLGVDRKIARSMIHPQYADRFIRQYILDEEIWRGK